MNTGEFKSRTSLNFFRASFSLLLNCYSLLRRSLSYSYIDMVTAAIGFWNFLLLPAEVTGSRISPDNGIIAKTCLQNLDFTATLKEPHLFLQRLYLMLSGLLSGFSVQIASQWIPPEAHFRANLLSRFVDKDDWTLNPEVFPQLNCKWGPHPIDRFASHYNAQVPRFDSMLMSPSCSAIDAFSMDWRSENNWLCPSVSLVVDVINRVRECRSVGTLIVPEWPSGFLWPLSPPFPPEFACFVVDVIYLPVRSDLIIREPD